MFVPGQGHEGDLLRGIEALTFCAGLHPAGDQRRFIQSEGTFKSWIPRPCQKQAQLTEEQHLVLHDCVCLWVWLQPLMTAAFPNKDVEKYAELFEKGMLV